MSNFQKYARFHIIVTLAAFLSALVLYLIPATSAGYLAGFSILSILGFGEIHFQNPKRKPIQDERDQQINHKAVIMAYTVFWVCFVGWGVLATMVFAQDGSLAVEYVEPVVWIAFGLVTFVRATSVLIQYGQDD